MSDDKNKLQHLMTESLLVQGNNAFLQGDYALAIEYFEAAKQFLPAMAAVIDNNIKLATKKLEAELGLTFLKAKLDDDVTLTPYLRSFVVNDNTTKPEGLLVLDSVTNGLAKGWALDRDSPGRAIPLQIAIDTTPVALITPSLPREDVQQVHGGDGFSGFEFEINPYACYNPHAQVNVTALNHQITAEHQALSFKPWQPMLSGIHYKNVEKVAAKLAVNYVTPRVALPNSLPALTIVIVNKNQLASLQACLIAILRFNDSAELILVDDASADGSATFIRAITNKRIKTFLLDKPLGFAACAQLAAQEAQSEALVFIQPDILVDSDIFTDLLKALASKQYAVVSATLWQKPELSSGAVQNKIPYSLGLQFNGLARQTTFEPFEQQSTTFFKHDKGIRHVPAVSALLLGVYKQQFLALGGFNHAASLQLAGVELCLRLPKGLNVGVLLEQGAYVVANQADLASAILPAANTAFSANALITDFRRKFRVGQFEQPGFWNLKPLAIAMIVSEVSLDTDKADFFTAKELGDALEQEHALVVGYFDENTPYDMTGYDVVIVYVDSFDPRRLKNLSPHCVVIGWARNWFDSWCDRPWIEHYDMLYASSALAQNYMQQRLKRHVGLLRIAASTACLQQVQPVDAYKADYVFTGSYFHSPREITDALEPAAVPFAFKLFGHNWAELPHFGQYSSGPVSYTEIPKVYASARLVVDDANIATKKWGALNCRVYDALAAGVPCITNNQMGVAELFEDDFPTYTVNNLNERISALLSDNVKLARLAEKYAAKVRAEHTYPIRAQQLLNDVKAYVAKKKLAIKIAAPDFERGVVWGDYYFARALRNEFEQAGYTVRIDCLDQWYAERSLNDDTNIVLRGLTRFKPRQDQQNLLWIISHPDLICEEELRDYQQIFVASELYQRKLQQFTGLENIETLLQASSYSRASLASEQLAQTPQHDILFIGNSRDQYREVVRWCVEENLPITVYGEGWEQFIPAHYIKGQFICNDDLPYYYHNATVVLNDHWPDMLRQGFVSNRVFDVLCAGGVVLSDEVFCELLAKTSNYLTYKNKPDFLDKINTVLANDFIKQPLALELVSFKARAASLMAYL